MQIIGWDNAVNRERAEIVFENRNHEYGGYQIRRNYEKQLIVAFLETVGGVALIFAIPFIISHLSKEPAIEKVMSDDGIEFTPPPVIEKLPMPRTVTPVTPVQQTIKFTPPVVVKDVLVNDAPPANDKFVDLQVGKETHTGTDNTTLPPIISEPINTEGPPYSIVEEMPIFPGGEPSLFKFLSANIKYPREAAENGIAGVVHVQFVIDKEGKVRNAKVLHGIGWGCDEEALCVINSMPLWKPGRQNGNNVSVLFSVPVRFTLR